MSQEIDEPFEPHPAASPLHSRLLEFLRDGKYCDVEVHVEGSIFKCHRVVLASMSKYFDSMFGGSFKEGRSDSITLHEIDPMAFETLSTYIYCGCLPFIDASNVYELLKASDFLGLGEVEHGCVSFVRENKHSINVLEIFSLARALNNTALVNELSEYIVRHFATFVKKSMFLDLKHDDLNALMKLYRSSSSLFSWENFLLDALVRWVYYSSSERKKAFEELIEMVDFERISAEYIEFLIEKYKVDGLLFQEQGSNLGLKRGPSLKKAVIDGLMLNNDSADHDVLPVSYEEPQFSKHTLTLHLWFEDVDEWQTAYTMFSMDKNKIEPEWIPSCSFSKRNSGKYVSPFDSYVVLDKPNYVYCNEYVWDPHGKSYSFHAYPSIDFSTEPFLLTPFPVARSYFYHRPNSMSGTDGNIYLYENDEVRWTDKIKDLLPGFSKEEYERNIYHYNCDIDKWFPVPEMKVKLINSYLISDLNLVYLIGGKDSNNVEQRNYVQAYDHRAPHWIELPNTISAQHNRAEDREISSLFCSAETATYSGCTANGKLYLFYCDLIQAFDPVAGRWEKVKEYEPVEGRRKLKMVFYDNLLWIFSESSDTPCEVYDFATQEWRTLGSLASILNMEYEYGFDIVNVFIFNPLEA